jgi:hypothetical protein
VSDVVLDEDIEGDRLEESVDDAVAEAELVKDC